MMGNPVLLLLVSGLLACEVRGQCEVEQFQGEMPGSLGSSVSMCGSVAVVNGGAENVIVYRYNGASWDWEAEIEDPEPDPENNFGRASCSGDVIVAGNPNRAAPEFHQGAAYVFRREGVEWQLEQRLTASDGDFNDKFGFAVAVGGDLIVVGARDDENDEGVSKTGSAYVFRYQDRQWTEEAKLTDPEGEEFDLFGVSAAILGDVAILGAHGNDDLGFGTGAAFVFRYLDDECRLESQLNAFDAKWQAWFGLSVAMADNVAVIGAPKEGGDDGAVYVLRYDGEEWQHEAKLVASEPVGNIPQLGDWVAVAPSGTTVLAGAPLDQAHGFNSGAAYVFRCEAGLWTEIAKLTASDGQAGDMFGSVAMIEDVAFIGAGGQSESAGSVYVLSGLSGTDCNANGEPDSCDIFEGTSEDEDGNGVPDECPTAGDANGDGQVDFADVLAVLASWGPCPPGPDDCPADLDGDGLVGFSDLLIVLSEWGEDA